MNLELLFSAASLLSMAGWLLLLASPAIPILSDKIAGLVIPLVLSVGYVVLALFFSSGGDGGFGSLADVSILFSKPESMLAGWIHFLAFDLIVGAWICRTARQEQIKFYMVLPCLPLTFLLGPAGFVAFSLVRQIVRFRSATNSASSNSGA